MNLTLWWCRWTDLKVSIKWPIFLVAVLKLDTGRYPGSDLFNISVDRELDSSIALRANVGNLAVATKLWRQLLKKRPLNTQLEFQEPPTFLKGDPITLKIHILNMIWSLARSIYNFLAFQSLDSASKFSTRFRMNLFPIYFYTVQV